MDNKYTAAHTLPQGPGDTRPTALQIIKDEGLEGNLAGKVILITGCSSGIGIETARAFFKTGATLYLAARSLSKANEALGDIVASKNVHLLELDLNSLESVRAAAADFLSKSKTLNIFIANAGIMACPEGRTEDGFETQFGINHLAHFLLFNLLRPTLLASSTPEFNSRAIFVASVGHRFAEPDFSDLNSESAYDKIVAYGRSKTGTVWTANEIDRRYGSKGLRAFSLHPGGIQTDLFRHLSEAEVGAFAAQIAADKATMNMFKSPEQGAATTVWAATAKELDGKGGLYLEDCHISKPWDPATGQWGPGHATWAYDAGKAGKLWEKSLELVGLKDAA